MQSKTKKTTIEVLHIKRLIHKINNKESGTTVIEFSVIAALLFIFIFGIIEYSLIFLQEHYVANAAREGARVGARANRYLCHDGYIFSIYSEEVSTCPAEADRLHVVKGYVADYLETFYDESAVKDNTTVEVSDLGLSETPGADPMLTVTVTVDRLFTSMTPALLGIIRSGSFDYPDTIVSQTSVLLEDPEEYDP